MSKRFNVAIIGGGMGGLCLAVALVRSGIRVDIFEQAEKFEEVGAGVSIGPNAIQALRKLGILDHVLRIADEPLSMRMVLFMSGLPDHNLIYDYPGLDSDLGLGVHRARFLDTLVKLLPPDIAHFNKKCLKVLADEVNPGGAVTAFFEDGGYHTADILIGCDGIKSSTRTVVVGEVVQPTFTQTIAFRGLIPIEAGENAIGPNIRKRPHAYIGPNRHLIVFPINGGTTVNVVVFVTDRRPAGEGGLRGPQPGQPWVVPSTQEEMLSYFKGWGPQVTDLLNNITHPNKWFLHLLDPPCETYVKGRIALLGDAAHAMLPHLGAGAGQAIEDAYILSWLLSHPQTTNSNIESVLKAYDHVRRPRANEILRRSRQTGEVYECCGPSGSEQMNVRQDLQDINSFVWHHDLDDDIKSAVNYLVERSIFTPKTVSESGTALQD